MAQSVPGESPPGVGGGGIPISNTNVALWDQQIQGQGRNVFFPKFNNEKMYRHLKDLW